MNKSRRKKIAKVIETLHEVSRIISFELSQEEYTMDNYPENFQNSTKFLTIEKAVDTMSDAVDTIDGVVDSLSEIV